MSTSPWLWRLAAALSGLTAIWALSHGAWWLGALTKPLATLLIWWPLFRQASTPRARKLHWGLLASTAGDISLLWPEEGFLPGLVSFLVAHLLYAAAFWPGRGRLKACAPALAAYAVLAGGILSWLWPGVPVPLQPPVIVYVSALTGMAVLAYGEWRTSAMAGLSAGPFLRLSALGGLCFVLSDAYLAGDKFQGPLPAAAAVVLTLYWLSQGLMAASVEPVADQTARQPG